MLKLFQPRRVYQLLPSIQRFSSKAEPLDLTKPYPVKKEKTNLISRDDPNTFGTLSVNIKEGERDEDDLKEEEFIENAPFQSQKLFDTNYAKMMKDYLKNGRIYEAIDVIETRMLKEDRVKPTNYLYNIALNGCAKVGYTHKAFSLYNRMKERQLEITGATYTSLFNACALAKFPKDGLKKAHHLREIIVEKGYVPNITNYNAMIKVFGRLGDVKTAFQIVDEMQTRRLPVRVETMSFLLQACASDKEVGFRHAILVWQKMHSRNMIPNIFSFNLLLRVTRDCGLGDCDESRELFEKIVADSKIRARKIAGRKTKDVLTIGTTVTNKDGTDIVKVQINSPDDLKPNLMAVVPKLGNLVAVSEIATPEDRLLLLGGMKGFFDEMDYFRVTPDIKTCTQMLHCIPSTYGAEKELLRFMKERRVKADIDFFNMLIKKRALRSSFKETSRVLSMIKTANLEPDIMTYGVLAIACQKKEDAEELLEKMSDRGIRPNIEILGAMFNQGIRTLDLAYATKILDKIRELQIQPSNLFVSNVYHALASNHRMMNFNDDATEEEKQFTQNAKEFEVHAKRWIKEMGIQGLSKEETKRKYGKHPYQQFREPAPEGYEPEKNPIRRHWSKRRGKIAKIK